MRSAAFDLKNYSTFSVAFLLLHPQIGAEVIYTDIDPDITLQFDNETVEIDMDNNGTIDFAFLKTSKVYTTYSISVGFTFTLSENVIWAGPYRYENSIACPYSTFSGSHHFWPYAFPYGYVIDENRSFTNFGYQKLAGKITGIGGVGLLEFAGRWWPVADNYYLGVHFMDEIENYHYGWIRCSIDSAEKIVIKDYAYETEPEHGIITGDTVSYVGINEIENTIDANVYSFEKNIYIHLHEINNTILTIYDDSERKLIERTFQNGNETINMDKYPQGVYFVRLLQGHKHLDRKVFIQ